MLSEPDCVALRKVGEHFIRDLALALKAAAERKAILRLIVREVALDQKRFNGPGFRMPYGIAA